MKQWPRHDIVSGVFRSDSFSILAILTALAPRAFSTIFAVGILCGAVSTFAVNAWHDDKGHALSLGNNAAQTVTVRPEAHFALCFTGSREAFCSKRRGLCARFNLLKEVSI